MEIKTSKYVCGINNEKNNLLDLLIIDTNLWCCNFGLT